MLLDCGGGKMALLQLSSPLSIAIGSPPYHFHTGGKCSKPKIATRTTYSHFGSKTG